MNDLARLIHDAAIPLVGSANDFDPLRSSIDAVESFLDKRQTEIPRFWLSFEKHGDLTAKLKPARLERAIDVIYRPDTERASHCFTARLPEQFDAIIHIDETRPVEPLERSAEWDRGRGGGNFPGWIVTT